MDEPRPGSSVAARTAADPPTLVALHRFRRESWVWGIALPAVVGLVTGLFVNTAQVLTGDTTGTVGRYMVFGVMFLLANAVAAFMGRFWLYRRIEGLVQHAYADARVHARHQREKEVRRAA